MRARNLVAWLTTYKEVIRVADDFTLWEEELNESSDGLNMVRSLIDMISDMYAAIDPMGLAAALADMGIDKEAEYLRSGGNVLSLPVAHIAMGCIALNVIPVTLFVSQEDEDGANLAASAVKLGRMARAMRSCESVNEGGEHE